MLLDASGRLWCIDNALCFNRHETLRTVIWDFAGERLPEAWQGDIRRVRDCLRAADASTDALRACLQDAEVEALIRAQHGAAGAPRAAGDVPLALRPLAAGLVAARGQKRTAGLELVAIRSLACPGVIACGSMYTAPFRTSMAMRSRPRGEGPKTRWPAMSKVSP